MRVATYTATARIARYIQSYKCGVLSLHIERSDDVDTEPVPVTIRHTTSAAGRGCQQLRLVETCGNRRQSFQVLCGPRGVGKTVSLATRPTSSTSLSSANSNAPSDLG